MQVGSITFDPSSCQGLTEKLEALVLAICMIQQHPPPDGPMQAAIMEAELTRLAAAGQPDGHELDLETFDRLATAIRAWRLSDPRQR